MTCDANKATRSKTKKLTFSLAAIKVCNSTLRWRTPISGCESTHFGRKNPSSFPPKDCALLHVDFLSRYDEITAFHFDQTQRRRVSKILFQNPLETGNSAYVKITIASSETDV